MTQKNTLLNIGDIDSSVIDTTGNSSIGYPQISIRVNRTAQRTDLQAVIDKGNSIADQYPDKTERAEKVIEALNEMFGGGDFGHTWIIIFHSATKGDYSTYAYHETFGYVHDGDTDGQTNDTADRGFGYEYITPITQKIIQNMENSIIPQLNQESTAIGKTMGITPTTGRQGVYTAITNCTWFGGNLFNTAMNDTLVFTQKFDGATYAQRWGIDALASITEIADPGMIAESLAKRKQK
ncbi:hypothetical protein COMNV_01235 [Commensalibacter sp. Nvir]|nr:hypothetical protein COMNV_01235 [Commensalibacter sp. Nvir]